jgi:hypothetical protein
LRKSIALEQLRKIPRSESKLQTGMGGYYLDKKFILFMLILVGIGWKTGFLGKGILCPLAWFLSASLHKFHTFMS